MQKSESIAGLAAALCQAQAAMKTAEKSGVNPHFKKSYASLVDVWEACREALAANGLSVAQFPTSATEEGAVGLTTILLHTSGEYLSDTYEMLPERKGPQGAGSALTYMRRYALSAVLGIVADEDDDGAAASDSRSANGYTSARRQAPPRPAPRPAPPPFERRQAVTELLVEAEAHGFTERDVLQRAGHDYGVTSVDELTDEQAGALLARLQKKATA